MLKDIDVLVCEIISHISGISGTGLNDNQLFFDEMAEVEDLDSITFMSLIVEIEEKFDIIIPTEILVIDNFKKKSDIVNIIKLELEKKKK